ncbi:hypothetical protein ACET3Z_004504 [Daucus carota]
MATLPPTLNYLGLSSCNLKEFPHFSRDANISFYFIDLSNNKIEGEIPHWIGSVGRDNTEQSLETSSTSASAASEYKEKKKKARTKSKLEKRIKKLNKKIAKLTFAVEKLTHVFTLSKFDMFNLPLDCKVSKIESMFGDEIRNTITSEAPGRSMRHESWEQGTAGALE